MTDKRAMEILRGAKLTPKELKEQRERAKVAQVVVNKFYADGLRARELRRAQIELDRQGNTAEDQERIAAKIEELRKSMLAWREEAAILASTIKC